MADKEKEFSKKFILHATLACLLGVLVLLVAVQGFGIHIPYLAAISAGVGIGWLQPRKGWMLALLQVLVLGFGFAFFVNDPPRADLAKFSVYGSVGLILVGGLLGGVLKRHLV